ncbi:Phospho-2-dehydro-3-deoxyheptonate aldolase [Zancudomyces culisetae]|uniref:Phospho-2-dehydro-3-deoxyheptonate aldolase n=1 Tax=Zancudomyces culisetae TaxID=1213189 RepID=A0A1R1PKG3_ZANCU|nr:Phospho-2-dehydro-3-deoxyheptonate aldolase [Zancudomyces culisetae]|eukprot:OMH81468.1 Phospho-2-dehydro-3-deoxyheptonate aldolase [Zancudomyces culisetae]
MTPNKEWTPNSWRAKPIKHNVEYTNQEALGRVLENINNLPPLVSPAEIDRLNKQLEKVSKGEAFLLQGGDCAESFSGCNAQQIEDKIKILLQMSLVMIWGMRVPLIRIARMGGQYAKPRSANTEVVDGKEVLTFRGENINGLEVDDREPNPDRLLRGYFHSAATVNYIRTLLNSDFANLHFPQNWNLEWVKSEDIRSEYKEIINKLADAFDFMKTIGVENGSPTLSSIDFYLSHEGLMLEYEEAMTERIQRISQDESGKTQKKLSFVSLEKLGTDSLEKSGDKYYNLSSHFLWIGDRTRQINGAHVEYFRGIANPIGLKVGPSLDPEELVRLLDILDPDFIPGKVTLIGRYGVSKVQAFLPQYIKAVQATNHKVVWCCDPCHGNTASTPEGYKTREYNNVIGEIGLSFDIHKTLNSKLNGIHLELTGEHVTECTGGSMNIEAKDLSRNYQSFCDPRLNYLQSLDIAFMVAKKYQ